MLKESEDDIDVVHTPGAVHCLAWCGTTNRLWVVHYNDDGTRVMASRHYLESAQIVASPALGRAWNGHSIQLDLGPQYYQACMDGNKLILVGRGPTEDGHTVVIYDTNTGQNLAWHVEYRWMDKVVGMCIAKNDRGESLLVVSIQGVSGWRLELWAADFARPQLLDTPYPLPGPAGPLCFTDGMLLVVNMTKSCIEEYTVASTRIERVGGCIAFVESTYCLCIGV